MAGLTTQNAVYEEIIRRLRNNLALDDAHIFIAPQPTFNDTWTQAVQLIPPVLESRHPDTGTGLIREEFQTAYWHRQLLDQANRSTLRIAGDAGLIAVLANDTRAALRYFWPTELTIACHLIRSSVVSASDDYPGWVEMSDTWRCGYELSEVQEAEDV